MCVCVCGLLGAGPSRKPRERQEANQSELLATIH